MSEDHFDDRRDRRAAEAQGAWADHAWLPHAVLPAAPATAPWTSPRAGRRGRAVLRRRRSRSRCIRPRPRITATISRPAGRRSGCRCGRSAATRYEVVDGDGRSLRGRGARRRRSARSIEAVPMPAEIQAKVAAFFEAFHVERAFFKRKRDRADPEALGAPPAGPRAAGTTNERRVPLPLVAAARRTPGAPRAVRSPMPRRRRPELRRAKPSRRRCSREPETHAGGARGAAQGRGAHGRERHLRLPAQRRPGCAAQRGAPPDVVARSGDPRFRRRSARLRL